MDWNVNFIYFSLQSTPNFVRHVGAGHPGEEDIGGLVLVCILLFLITLDDE
jgi:hypothetical protein